MNMTMKTVIAICALFGLPAIASAQAIDPVLTYPPSPGPTYVDTSSYPQSYNTPSPQAGKSNKAHTKAKSKKQSEQEEYSRRRAEEDSAWQQFINQPASMETKMAPKYINTKTAK